MAVANKLLLFGDSCFERVIKLLLLLVILEERRRVRALGDILCDPLHLADLALGLPYTLRPRLSAARTLLRPRRLHACLVVLRHFVNYNNKYIQTHYKVLMNEENKNEQNKNKDKPKFHCTQCGGKAFSNQLHHKYTRKCDHTLVPCTGLYCPRCPAGKYLLFFGFAEHLNSSVLVLRNN